MKYIDMVRNLSKPVEDIHAQLTPFKCGLIHSAMGISGEVGELFDAIDNSDPKNIIEELGDLIFYVQMLDMYCGFDSSYLPKKLAKDELGRDDSYNLWAIKNSSNEILDLVKKHCIYGKDLSDKLQANSLVLKIAISFLVSNMGITIYFLKKSNMNKLLNGRYKSGSYSDAQAIERADKNV